MINWETLEINKSKISKKNEIIDSFFAFMFCCILFFVILSFIFKIFFNGEKEYIFLKILVPTFIFLFIISCSVAYDHIKAKYYDICVELNLSENYDLNGIFSNQGALLSKIDTKIEDGSFIIYLPSELTTDHFYLRFKDRQIISKNGKIYFTAKILREKLYDKSFYGGYKNSEDFKNDLEKNLQVVFKKLYNLQSMDKFILNNIVKSKN